jgi:phosphoribosyl 1,2-cyclic phosphodiesterase
LELLRRYPLAERRPIAPRRRTDVCGITFEAFTLEHSLRAPAVGFRVSAGGRRFFYAPDLVSIHQRAAALAGLDLYIGDGASLERDIVRRRGGRLIGHASVREQLRWCAEARVPRVVITHCGTQIVTGHAAKIEAWLQASAREHGLELRLAHDGMVVSLRRHA